MTNFASEYHNVTLEGALGGNQARDEVGSLAIADLNVV